MPEISVIMPIYNSEKYVADAINSLLDQTYSDFEIIAINDGSKDNCGSVVSTIHDDRLIFVDDKENHGFLATLNRCISMARGKYIARLDDDDIAYPDRLRKQIEFMEGHPDVVLCGTSFDQIIDGERHSVDMPPVYTDSQFKFSLAFDNACIPHSSFMMRRDVMEKQGIKYETYLQVPDYHMQTQMCEVGAVHFIREPLVGYRIHATQSTAVRSIRMKTGEFDRARLWYIHRLPISESDKTILCKAALRKLSNKCDYMGFADALIRYAEYCGMKNEQHDRECISFILRNVLEQQKRSVSLLSVYKHERIKAMGIKKPDFRFTVKCILGYSPNYFESDYAESDDGSVDKHSVLK